MLRKLIKHPKATTHKHTTNLLQYTTSDPNLFTNQKLSKFFSASKNSNFIKNFNPKKYLKQFEITKELLNEDKYSENEGNEGEKSSN